MRDNLGYLFAAYFVLWIISFILVASIAVRQKRLEREIDRLRKGLEDRDTDSASG